jgi:hypothetical protein
MPDVLDMLQSNPEMAESLAQPPSANTPAAGELVPRTDEQQSRFQDQMSRLPAFIQARHARTAGILADPELANSMETHHQAVADATAFHHQASQELAYSLAAHTLHDTAAFYQAAHGITADDPQYEAKMLALAQQYPHAKPDAQLMQPLHEARKTYLTANSAAEQQKGEKEVQDYMKTGHLTMNDLTNPAFDSMSQNDKLRALQFLGASRAGSTVMPNEFERELIKTYGQPGSTAYNKLYKQVQSGNAQSIAIHNAYWNALKKADPGLATRLGAQSGTAPVTATGGGNSANDKYFGQ